MHFNRTFHTTNQTLSESSSTIQASALCDLSYFIAVTGNGLNHCVGDKHVHETAFHINHIEMLTAE
jgi:hypothetical protein